MDVMQHFQRLSFINYEALSWFYLVFIQQTVLQCLKYIRYLSTIHLNLRTNSAK